MARYVLCEHCKTKGRYPVDSECVLYISPYWSQALALAEKKKDRKSPVRSYYVGALVFVLLLFLCDNF